MNEMQEDMKEMRENIQRDKIFDREAFNKDMNKLRENLKSRREELKNNMDQMRENMKKMRVNMRENFPWYRQWN